VTPYLPFFLLQCLVHLPGKLLAFTLIEPLTILQLRDGLVDIRGGCPEPVDSLVECPGPLIEAAQVQAQVEPVAEEFKDLPVSGGVS